ncbi:MAG: ribosome maturation factor RimP [Bacteroidia bacterium]|nr:MAG: ribosome maturation factor RimP [Bacteroidia bacterium]
MLPVLERRNAFLVDVQVRVERKSLLVQAFTDTDEGITIQECADISREVRPLLEAQGLGGPEGLMLEISSPGVDRPLKFLRQYRKNIGRTFRVRFTRGADSQTITGTLTAVEGETLTFQPEQGEAIALPFETILESKEELPW